MEVNCGALHTNGNGKKKKERAKVHVCVCVIATNCNLCMHINEVFATIKSMQERKTKDVGGAKRARL